MHSGERAGIANIADFLFEISGFGRLFGRLNLGITCISSENYSSKDKENEEPI